MERNRRVLENRKGGAVDNNTQLDKVYDQEVRNLYPSLYYSDNIKEDEMGGEK
jgi:hypothetical protein